ncbi:hypothetical protein [Nonomuraea sp. NPDC050783]|uniref:hypothetical protein n=1 Tax=Nonomuraea sp. NPDC050783 TaxID=3154634 RepID=UPI0034656509
MRNRLSWPAVLGRNVFNAMAEICMAASRAPALPSKQQTDCTTDRAEAAIVAVRAMASRIV